MAATIEFQQAAGRVYFEAGYTEDGKLIRKAKTYSNIKENAPADNLYQALEQLGSYPLCRSSERISWKHRV